MEVEERAEGGFIDERGKTYLSTTATLQNMYTTTPWPLAPPAHQKVLPWSTKEEDRKNKGHGAQDTS